MAAYTSIWRVEGLVAGLYRGTLANIARYCTVLYSTVTLANIARNAIVNVGETVVYDAVKGGGARCGEWSEAWLLLLVLFRLFKNPRLVPSPARQEALVRGGHMVEGVGCHLASAVLAGITATMVASPVDVVKTRSASRLELQRRFAKDFTITVKDANRAFSPPP